MTDCFKVLGVDIGGTKIAVCITDSNGNILASDRVPTSPYATALKNIIEMANQLAIRVGGSIADIKSCGICAPGPLDMIDGRMLKSPNMTWDNVPIVNDLQKALKIPVAMDNDANAAVLAEWFFGSGKGKKDIVYLTMSTGVGGGVISGGHLITGTTKIGAELGHIVLDANGPLCGCGQSGCLEAYCGGRNVADHLKEAVKNDPNNAIFKLACVDGKMDNLNFQALLEGAKAEIPLCVKMWDEFCFRLAQGIGICLITFNPELITLGTTAYYAGDFMMEPVMRYLPMFGWKEMRKCCQIGISTLGLKIGELAGASVALNHLYEKGLWNTNN
ncbi:MAG: ROK family protein [Lentisphaeria bacterium]